MYGLYFSGFTSRSAVAAIFVVFALVLVAESSSAGMLVAEGKRSHYIANQDEGIVYVVYGNGEWVRFADGMGYICGLAVCPDESLYVLSRSQQRMFKIAPDGAVVTVRKLRVVPETIYVDRDGEVRFVHRNGVIADSK
ncbi:hypothetical protein [Desulfovibrio sp. JC022]|uniref:hypothetical protein n=1 Tax=Desulfovibrio sp. JC022 TaxID=2593642 RepID=UPI0013D579A2|nr:hypothetical protein [Desulfovibrio sp. JC022]NDV22864.1 hypothetical protein [Desulfovibrio sp. JC022]